jgi:type IV secretory pathway VirB6-like protein
MMPVMRMTVMPDYYAILARAIVGLEPHDATTRAELYERAREIIASELRKQNPNISALAIAREQALLEVDIRRLESDLAPPATSKKDDRHKRDFTLADELDVMPRSLAALLFGIAYLTAIIAFSGVIYIRGLALVYAHIIGYPVLIGVMAILGCLFVPLSRKVFRKLRV